MNHPVGRRAFFIVLMSATCLLSSAAKASNQNENFSTVCPKLLAQSDAFATECIKKATSLTRNFNGAPETHSAYFQTGSSGSHFRLGCTLDAIGELATLGIYYSVGLDFDTSQTNQKIVSITFDGDVRFRSLNSQTDLVLIREIVTSNHRPGRYYAGIIKNCEPATGVNGLTRWVGGSFVSKFSAKKSGLDVAAIELGTYCYPSGSYTRLLGGDDLHPIWTNAACMFFIMDDGSLAVANEVYKRSCVTHEWKNGIVGQACPPPT